jgi:hypothetical protein
VACSGGGGGGGSLSAFTGIWQPTAVTEVITCNGQATTYSVTDNLTWATSASNGNDIVSTGSCTLAAAVSGSTASTTGSESCSVKTSNGTTVLVTLDNFSFRTDDGESATVTANGTASESGIDCTFTEMGGYRKVANGT